MVDFLLYLLRSNFGDDKIYYKGVNKMFGIYPRNIDLYKMALIHKSASVVLDSGEMLNNERLEYLGDAVIEAVISDMLYIDFPGMDEGVLTQMRSKIVSRQSLNELATKIGLEEYVIVQSSLSGNRKHLYGDAFEALIGAIYLDKGYNYVNRILINGLIAKHVNLSELLETETDYKSRLIEWCQKRRKKLIIDCRPEENYREQEPHFVAIASIDGQELGYGIGGSKKEAGQRAAKNTIEKLRIVL